MAPGANAEVITAVEDALAALAPSAEEQVEVLEKCLQLIDAQLPASAHDGPVGGGAAGEQRWAWTLRRVRALQHHERVGTTNAVCGGTYNPEVYAALRDEDVADAAAAFARAGNVPAVCALLQRHPFALAPRVLDSLAAAPETTPAKAYEPALRAIAALRGPPPATRSTDWVESEAVCSALRRHGEHRLLLATEPLAQLNFGWAPPSEDQLAAWVCARAVAVDRLTGCLEAANALLEAARAVLHYGAAAAALEPLQRAAAQLMMTLKLAAGRASENEGGDGGNSSAVWRLGLGHFAALDDAGRLQAFLQLVDSETLERDILAAVLPFLHQLESPAPADVLVRVLEREAALRLPWVVKFVQLEAERPAALGSAAEVAAAAAGAAYACPSADAWGLQEALLSAAAEAIARGGGGGVRPGQLDAAQRAIDQAQGHLTAARLLTRHGAPTPLAEVRDADEAAVRSLVQVALARACRGRTSEGRWRELWDDLAAARAAGLPALPELELRTEFCSALLHAGQVRLAKQHLPELPPATQEALVLAAARDCFAAEDSDDDTDPDDAARQAKAVLAALPDSRAAVEEGRVIDAAQKLRALGVDVGPQALGAAANKEEMLEQALRNAPAAALRDVDGFVELAAALGAGGSRAQVVAKIAGAALDSGDAKLAEQLCMQLARQQQRAGWEVAARVAGDDRCSSDSARRSLLSFALRFAPGEQVAGLLGDWQAADAAAMGADDSWASFSGEHGAQPMLQAVQLVLQDFLSPGVDPLADDPAMVLSCLLALGPEAGPRWEQLLQQAGPGLEYETSRQAYLLGITTCLLTALQPAALDAEHLAEHLAAAQHRINASPWQLLAMLPAPVDAAAVASTSAAPSQEAGLASEPSESGDSISHSEAAAPPPSAAPSSWPVLVRLCQQLVAAADAQRVARLLPGVDASGLAGGGDAALHRAVVLQLAAAAAAAGAEADPGPRSSSSSSSSSPGRGRSRSAQPSEQPDLSPRSPGAQPGAGRKKSEAVSDALVEDASRSPERLPAAELAEHATLEQALALAQRYGVPGWEVQLRYASAALQHGAARRHVAKVWPELLGHGHAKAALEMLLKEAYPAASRPAQLRLCLELMKDCCEAERGDAAAAWAAAVGVLGELECAAGALASAAPGLNVKAFLQPSIALIASWAGLPPPGSNGAAARDLPLPAAELLAHADAANVTQLAAAIDSIAVQHAALVEAVGSASDSLPAYPVSSSTAYQVVLCQALAEAARSGRFSNAQLEAWVGFTRHMATEDAVAVLAHATIGGPPPLALPRGAAQPVIALSAGQAQQLLQACMAVIEASESREYWPDALQEQVVALQNERTRLSVLREVRSSCQLADSQLRAVQIAVAELQAAGPAPETVAGDDAGPVRRCLQELLVSGCAAADAVRVAAALLPLAAPLDADAAERDAAASEVQAAAEAAVHEALQVMGGASTSGDLSAGDAVQNLYGMLRALDSETESDAKEDAEGADGDEHAEAASLDGMRAAVWALLQEYASAPQAGGSAAAAEAHLQALHMLGSLGVDRWRGWAPPAGATSAAFDHNEALLFSRAAAALASAGWPGALQRAGVAAAGFGSAEEAEASVMQLLASAEMVEQLQAAAGMLAEVVGPAFPAIEAAGRPVSALHRGWSTCLTALLSHSCLPPVLCLLDAAAAAPAPVLTSDEAAGAVDAADAALGAPAAAAVALLLPYPTLQSAAWERALATLASTPADEADGLAPLAILALQQGRLAPLARSSPRALRQLCLAMLSSSAAALWNDPLEGCTGRWTVRSGLAASAAAALAAQRSYSAGGWVAMEHAGTHRLLRVLDSGPRALRDLLRAGANSGPAGGGSEVELSAAAAEAVVVPRAVEALVRRLPQDCALALQQLEADTQPAT